MSEEFTRKRQRSVEDEDDFYEPSNDSQQQQLPPHVQQEMTSSTLPPHLMANDFDDYAPPPHQINEVASNFANSHQPSYGSSHDDGAGGYIGNRGRYDGGGPRKRQRRMELSGEIERANELCSSLQSLGDSPYDVKMLLTQSSETMAYFWSDNDFSTSLLKFLGALTVEMPHKSVLVSGLIMLANAKNGQIAKDLLLWLKDRVNEVFNEMDKNDMDVDINNGDSADETDEMHLGKCWNRIFLIIRMLGLLVPIIEDVGVIFTLMERLLKFAIQLQDSQQERSPLAEIIFYEITLSIPYILINDRQNSELREKCQELIEISKSFSVRTSEHEDFFFKPIKSFNENVTCININEILKQAPEATEAYLDDLSVFYDIISIVDPLIKTVIGEKELSAETNNDILSNDGIISDEKTERVVMKHLLGQFNIPEFEILSNSKNLSEFASISDNLWKYPRFICEIFSNDKTRKELEFETIPKKNTYVSMILNDIILDILSNLEYNRVTISKHLINLPRYFNEKLFAKLNSPLDKLMIINDLNKGLDFDLIKNLQESTDFDENIKYQMISSAKRIQFEFEEGYQSTWKMEEIVLENIINLIFTLPSCKIPLVYFESLISDTCGRDWTLVKRSQLRSNESLLFSKLVGDCFRYFYDNIENLEFENIVRFINWFLFQISNFKFEWEWQEWITDVIQLGDENIYNPKLYFIKNVIHKEILITNYKFIKDKTLPIDLKKFANLSLKNNKELIEYDSKFFGEEFANSNTINPFEIIEETEFTEENGIVETNTDIYKLFSHYLFNHDNNPYNDICRDIYMNLENVDESIETLIELTDKLSDRINNENGNGNIIINSDEYIITLVVQSICLIGSRSFSVFEESLNKVFGDKLNSILERINNENKSQWIIDAVLRIWNSEPRIGFMTIERLSRFGALNDFKVIESVWNCSNSKVLPLAEVYADEFLNRILDYADEDDNEEELKKQKELIELYFNIAIKKLNNFCENVNVNLEYLNKLDYQSSDSEWGLKNIIGLIMSKIRKYKYSGINVDLKDIFESVNDPEIKELFIKSFCL